MHKLLRLFCTPFAAVALLAGLPMAHATTLGGTLTTDDYGYVYLSTSQSSLGTLIATASQGWQTPMSFSSIGLAPGVTYYLNLEVINESGPGGVLGQFSLSGTGSSFSNGTQTLLTNATDWIGGYNGSIGNSTSYSTAQRPWVTPTSGSVSFGANGVSPWGSFSQISSNADWIWAADTQSLPNGSTPCTYCMVDLSSTAITVGSSRQGAAVSAPGSAGILSLALLGLVFIERKRLSRR